MLYFYNLFNIQRAVLFFFPNVFYMTFTGCVVLNHLDRSTVTDLSNPSLQAILG